MTLKEAAGLKAENRKSFMDPHIPKRRDPTIGVSLFYKKEPNSFATFSLALTLDTHPRLCGGWRQGKDWLCSFPSLWGSFLRDGGWRVPTRSENWRHLIPRGTRVATYLGIR